MSVIISDIRTYGSANMPEADSATVGGAIDFHKRIGFSSNTVAGTYDVVSSSASDTATKITYSVREASGAIHNETLTLTGQTKVAGSLNAQRLLSAVTTGGSIAGLTNPGGTAAVGDVALISHSLVISAHTMQAGSANANTSSGSPAVAKLQAGDGASVAANMVLRTTGGTGANQIRRILAINPGSLGSDVVAVDRNWGTLPDNTTTYEVGYGMHFELTGSDGGVALAGTSTQVNAITRLFATAQADVTGGTNRTFYEKVFANNNGTALDYTSAAVEILSESPSLPSGIADSIGLTSALDDLGTIANRQTAPASVSFTAQPAFVSVPAPGKLAASIGAGDATSAQAIWIKRALTAGAPAYEGTPGADVRYQGQTQ